VRASEKRFEGEEKNKVLEVTESGRLGYRNMTGAIF